MQQSLGLALAKKCMGSVMMKKRFFCLSESSENLHDIFRKAGEEEEKMITNFKELCSNVDSSHSHSFEFYQVLSHFVHSKSNNLKAMSLFKDMIFSRAESDISTMDLMINSNIKIDSKIKKASIIEKEEGIRIALSILGRSLKLGLNPNVSTYNTIMKGFCELNRIDEAMKTHDNLLSSGYCGFVDFDYGTLAHALCKTKGANTAVDLLSKCGEPPDSMIYSLIIKSLFDEKYPSHAYDLYSEMINNKLPVSTMTYNTLVNELFAADERQARDVFYSMLSHNHLPDMFTFSTLIRQLGRDNNLKEAKACLAMMTKLDITATVATFTSLIRAFFIGKQVTKGIQFWKNLPHLGIRHDHHSRTLLIDELFDLDLVDEAIQVWESSESNMEEKGLAANNSSCDQLSGYLSKLVKAGEARRFYNRVEQKIHANLVRMNIVLDELAMCGQINKARTVFDQLTAVDTIAYTTMIKGYFMNNNCKEALVLFHQMKKNGCAFDSLLFETIIRGLLGIGDVPTAKIFYSQMIVRGFRLNASMVVSKLSPKR